MQWCHGMMKRLVLCGTANAMLAASGTVCASETLRVPSEYPTIQAGIDAAQNDDVVLVAPGTYFGLGNVDLNFNGKAITVRGENGQAVIDDRDGGLRLVRFNSGESSSSILEGFIVYFDAAAGVVIQDSSPTIRNCRFIVYSAAPMWLDNSNSTLSDLYIEGNLGSVQITGGAPTLERVAVSTIDTRLSGTSATLTDCSMTDCDTGWIFTGAGLSIRDSVATLTRCTIARNVAGYDNEYGAHGGGVYVDNSTVRFRACTIARNRAQAHFDIDGEGGGAYLLNSDTRFDNCFFERNFSESLGGAVYARGGETTFNNCTLVANTAILAGGAVYASGATATVNNSIVWANGIYEAEPIRGPVTVRWSTVQEGFPGEGNTEADPRFANPGAGDYRLADASPCIDSGRNDLVMPDVEFDLDGMPRFVNDLGMPDLGLGSAPIVDRGAHEFQAASTGINLLMLTSCPQPGPARIGWANASPGRLGVALVSTDVGAFRIPAGRPCPGTELGLSPVGLRVGWRGASGADGGRVLSVNLSALACGQMMQFIDVSTCNMSEVVQIR